MAVSTSPTVTRHGGAAVQVVRHREDSAEIVGRVPPLRREPGIVEIQPPHHGADVECRRHGIEFVRRPGHAGATGKHGSGDDGSEQPDALRRVQRQEAAGQRVEQTMASCPVGGLGLDPALGRVVGNRRDHGVRAEAAPLIDGRRWLIVDSTPCQPLCGQQRPSLQLRPVVAPR